MLCFVAYSLLCFQPKPEAQVLETTLLIYHVKDLHFETSYFVQYEDAGNIYRVPVLLYQKGTCNTQFYNYLFIFLLGETKAGSASGHVRHMTIFSMQIKIWSWET